MYKNVNGSTVVIAKNCEQPMSFINNKMECSCIIEYNRKMNKLYAKLNLKNKMLRKRNHSQKNIYCIIPFILKLKNIKNPYLGVKTVKSKEIVYHKKEANDSL